jgi:hypothetical protein
MCDSWVWGCFSKNWVFKLNSKLKLNYIFVAVIVSLIPWIIGVIGALMFGVPKTFLTNLSPYLNAIGFAIALIAFGWYSHKICEVIEQLCPAFFSDETKYKNIIKKWTDRIANKNWILLLASLPIMGLNLYDVIAIWSSSHPPASLAPWIASQQRLFFEIYYGILHAGITGFLLGSGIMGLVVTLLIFNDIFHHPLNLSFYRRTESVIELTTWLIMWTLIGLACVLVFGRAVVIFRVNIAALDISGIAQSVIATLLAIAIGTIPLAQISHAIKKAKCDELTRLEKSYDEIHATLIERMGEPIPKPVKTIWYHRSSSREDELSLLTKKHAMILELMKQVDSIPTLPIRWNSVARVIFGAVLSFSSALLRDWVISTTTIIH